MSEARQIESEAATYLDQISRYFLTRGKIVSKVAKYPHVVGSAFYITVYMCSLYNYEAFCTVQCINVLHSLIITVANLPSRSYLRSSSVSNHLVLI